MGLILVLVILLWGGSYTSSLAKVSEATQTCVSCHALVTPGIVAG